MPSTAPPTDDSFLRRLNRAERRDDARRRIRTEYQHLTPVSHGAHSNVFRAIRGRDGLHVAIKVFKKTELALSTFEREMEAYSHLFDGKEQSAAFVVEPFDAYRWQRDAWLVMQLGCGTLRRHMQRRPAAAEAARVLRQLVLALRHIHERGVAHRDLKPDNVVIVARDQLRLCDFGLARLCAQGERLYTICGSPSYMAPELYARTRNGYDGCSVDVWALGVVAYELLHHRLAFEAAGINELALRVRRGRHAPLRRDLPTPFRRFIERCLHVDPACRVTSAALPIPVPKAASEPQQAAGR